MLIQPEIWTAACALLPSVAAFYPYEPKYEDDSNGKNQRRAALSPPPHHPSNINDPRRPVTLPLHRVSISSRQNDYDIVNSGDPKQSNSVAVDQDGRDLSYMVAVTIGSSKEEYHLLLDSAASNTWVMGQECTTDACGRHNTFGEGDSDTLKTDSTPFSVTYGTGSVFGTTASDTVHVGSLSSELIFGLATNVSHEFEAYPMDGILGLGRGDTVEATAEAASILEVLSTSKLISTKLYGVHLSRASDGVNDGELNFGEPNKERYSGDLNWMDTVTNDRGFWEISIADAGADGTMTGLKGRTGIIDTGTSFILMSQDDAIAMHKLIDGYTQSGETFTVPCDTKKVMQVTFGSETYNISTADWIGDTLDTGGCKSNIIGRQTFSKTQWLMGDVFLKNVYTVFDFEKSKVGFGVKEGDSNGDGNGETTTNSPSKTSSAGESSSTTSAPSSTTTGADPMLPAGASAATSSSGTSNPTSLSEASPASQSAQQGGAGRASTPVSLFAILVTLGLLAMLI